MIPILFSWDTTDFTTNGTGRLSDCLSCTVHEEINGLYEADFSYPRTGQYFDDIHLGSIIYVTHDETGDAQPFFVTSWKRDLDEVVDFHAVHISYRLLNVTTYVKGSYNAVRDALAAIPKQSYPGNLNGFKLRVGTDEKPLDWWKPTGYFAAANGVPKSVKQILGGTEGSIIDTYGGQLLWDHFNVCLVDTRGFMRNFVVRHGVDMIAYEEDADITDTHIGVIPYWQKEENGSTTVVRAPVYYVGTIVGESPDIPYESVRPLDLTDKFESKPTAAQLTAMAKKVVGLGRTHWSSLGGFISVPRRTITIDFLNRATGGGLDELRRTTLGDQITMVNDIYNMSGFFQVTSLEWDVLQERTRKIELLTKKIDLATALGV